MRIIFSTVLLVFFCVQYNVKGYPTYKSSTDPNPGIASGDGLWAHNGPKIVHDDSSEHHTKLTKRTSKGKGKGKGKVKASEPIPPTTPPPKSDLKTPKKPSGKKKNPKTPANPPLSPDGNKKYPQFDLGECGTQSAAPTLRNAGAPPGTPIKRPIKIQQTPRTPKKSDDTEDDDNLKPGTKSLKLCGKKVPMEFPDYPSSGAFFRKPVAAKLKDISAYNAKILNPCKDNYEFGKVKFPDGQSLDLYTPKKKAKLEKGSKDSKGSKVKAQSTDQWETEHVIDAQIVKKFLQEMFELPSKEIKQKMIPNQWKTTERGDGYSRSSKYDPCSYLEQFWIKRWAAPNDGTDAVKYLLSVYPGSNDPAELLLLPGRLNNMKNQLFSIRGSNIIGEKRFEDASLNQKVDELREAILLMKYLNQREFRKSWRALSTRIRDRLELIEATGTDGYMRQTDDFWFKAKREHTSAIDKALKDMPGEKYQSVNLSARWGPWIDAFVKNRVDRMESLVRFFHDKLMADWRVAKTYRDLKPQDKSKFETRLKELSRQVGKTKVDKKKLSIVDPVQQEDDKTPENSEDNVTDNDSSDGFPDSPTPAGKNEKEMEVQPGPST